MQATHSARADIVPTLYVATSRARGNARGVVFRVRKVPALNLHRARTRMTNAASAMYAGQRENAAPLSPAKILRTIACTSSRSPAIKMEHATEMELVDCGERKPGVTEGGASATNVTSSLRPSIGFVEQVTSGIPRPILLSHFLPGEEEPRCCRDSAAAARCRSRGSISEPRRGPSVSSGEAVPSAKTGASGTSG